MKWLRCLNVRPDPRTVVAFIILVLPGGSAFAKNDPDLMSLVRSLYSNFASDSISSLERASEQKKVLQLEPLGKLRHYFVSDLAGAIHGDALCVERTREVCSIDFDILFDSQDSIATNFLFKKIDSRLVEVCFATDEKDRICLMYRGRTEAGKWKISDAIYGDGRSLRRILLVSSN